MLDQAFEALNSFDWGTDPQVLRAIDETVVTSQNDLEARKQLETRLAAVLETDVSRAAKDYVCRQLMIVGTADVVPALARLLSDPDLSHMARYALERIPAATAAQALRDAVPEADGALKAGLIGSLGTRGDAESVAALIELLDDADTTVARSAALALGAIRAPRAAQALLEAAKRRPELQSAATDAALACAEILLAARNGTAALVIYKALAGEDQPKQVRLAATRGMLACAGKAE
jgi:HEAT repeat protein